MYAQNTISMLKLVSADNTVSKVVNLRSGVPIFFRGGKERFPPRKKGTPDCRLKSCQQVKQIKIHSYGKEMVKTLLSTTKKLAFRFFWLSMTTSYRLLNVKSIEAI